MARLFGAPQALDMGSLAVPPAAVLGAFFQ